MNATPSPDEPFQQPADDGLKRYAQIHGVAQAALTLEHDPEKRMWLESVIAKTDEYITHSANAMSSGGAPVPNVPTPPPPMPAPQMGPPQAAPQAGPPGPAPAAPPPGAPPQGI